MRKISEADFWLKALVDKPTGCWNWSGALHSTGYGWITWRGRQYKTHRLAWELSGNTLPKGFGYHGLCVLHRCDNRKCINPAHLFLGTHQENMRDMADKGRSSRLIGPKNGRYVHGKRSCAM